MSDLISREQAIDAFTCTDELIVSGSANAQNVTNYINKVIGKIKALPSVQSKNEERMEKSAQYVPNDDFISRKRAIDAIEAVFPVDPMKSEYAQGIACGAALSKTYIEQLPSAQPEIVRCKGCKFWREHKYAKYAKETKRYIPFCGLNAIYTNSDDFCSKGERRTDEQTVSK